MKQSLIFEKPNKTNKYSQKVNSPIYEPKNKQPDIRLLCDNSKTKRLLRKIELAKNVTYQEKMFLVNAARRHNVFNYEKIADYYAHATKEMQELMEESALVIIDFEKAIELGYVKLSNSIRKQYLETYEK